MEKKFKLPVRKFTAEIFKSDTHTWVDITVSAVNESEAQEKIYNLMSENDIILSLKNDRGYLV